MTKLEEDHAEMVRVLTKPGADILKTLTPDKADLWHVTTGVATEGGELLDAIKKYCCYNKPLDRDNIREELGDLEFFMERVRKLTGITREESLEHNMVKLAKRYEDFKYSDQQAQERADKRKDK